MNYFTRQKISNHPVLTDVERYVIIESFKADARREKLEIEYRIEYIKDDTDISNSFTKSVPPWIVTNGYKVQVPDENGDPQINEGYEPEYEVIDYDENDDPIYGENIINSEDQYITSYAFDFFKYIIFDSPEPLRIKPVMQQYILKDSISINGGEGRFDF